MRKGFTLIELLVVIAIIAVLTTVGLSSFQNAAKSGRDGKRKGDLSQVRAALELYRSQFGAYPPVDLTNAMNVMRTNGYISDPLPKDPKVGYSYNYTLPAAGQYCLCAQLEILGKGPNTNNTCGVSATTTGDYFCVTQP